MRTNTTVIGALAVRRGEADALICGLEGRFDRHLRDIRQIIGKADRVQDFSTLSLLISSRGAGLPRPTPMSASTRRAEEIAETTRLAADHIRRFGIEPKAALLSHSNFGSRDSDSARKMRRALDILAARSARSSKSTARCTATRRCRRSCAAA